MLVVVPCLWGVTLWKREMWQGRVTEGVGMLLCYSLGLGIPFLMSAVLIDKLKGAFNWVKSHYSIVNLVSGGLLVIVGVLMATGMMGKWLALLS